ncbi:WD40 repeat domain-containing protein [Dactylosporangium cerinum]|uniref:WD40 repeat domain-containing protein n=1 Tax=Dactylosporangium cerinum TaxID=1434730 RepID=A0ABV9WHT5_9ACTN
MSRLNVARNVIGFVTALVVSFLATGFGGDAFDPFARLVDLLFAVVATAVAVLAAIVCIVILTKASARGAVMRRMLIPIQTVLLYPVAFAAPWVIGIYGYKLIMWTFHTIRDTGHPVWGFLVALVLALAAVAGLLSTAWYALVGAYVCATTLFLAAEGHPLLAPVAATAVAWVLPQLLRIEGSNALPSDPAGIALFYGGAVTVTLLSVLEVVRAAQVPGLDLRGAPPAAALPRVRGSRSFRLPALIVVVSFVGSLAATTAFAAVVIANTPEPTGAPVINTFHLPEGVDMMKVGRLSPDGKLIAAVPEGDKTYLFDTHTAKIVETLPLPVGYPVAVAFSADSRLLAVAGLGTNASKTVLWDVKAHKLVASPALPAGVTGHQIASLAFSNDGTRLAATLADAFTVQVWDTATGAGVSTFTVPGKQKSGDAYRTGAGGILYLPDNATMMVATAEGLFFLNAVSGAVTPLPGTTVDRIPGSFTSFAVSGDGSKLVVSTGSFGVTAARVSVWDLRTGTAKQAIDVPGGTKESQVASLALNDDGSLVAAGDSSGHIYLWATVDGHPAGTLDTQASWSIGGRPKDRVVVQTARGLSVLMDYDELDNVVLWDLADLHGTGAWNKAAK